MKKETLCIHSSKKYQGVNTPIYPSTANRYIGYGNVYPRYFNTENQQVLEEKLCNLEHGEAAMVFSSGMAAISTTLLSLLKPGDHAIFPAQIYGGSFKFIFEDFKKYSIEFDFVSENTPDSYAPFVKKNTKLLYLETPSNPLLHITDLRLMVKFAKKYNLLTVIDNTFATPINQRPIKSGFDVVCHSGTKYLGGHSDLCFGAVITSKKIKDKIYNSAINFGGSLNALDCYLIERSIKTLAVRVEKQNQNALKVAQYLEQHSLVEKVYYPGLASHPDYTTAKKQMNNGFGGMLAFKLSNKQLTDKFLEKLNLIIPAVSLGGVETIICQPWETSHAKMPEKEREEIGITYNLLRLSVGIEAVEDIIADIDQALL